MNKPDKSRTYDIVGCAKKRGFHIQNWVLIFDAIKLDAERSILFKPHMWQCLFSVNCTLCNAGGLSKGRNEILS